VERCSAGQTAIYGVNRPGGDVLEPDQVLNTIRVAAGRPVEKEYASSIKPRIAMEK